MPFRVVLVARVRHLSRVLSSLAADRDPLSDRRLVGACSVAQLGLGPVPGRLQLDTRLGQSEGDTRVLGEEVRPAPEPRGRAS